MARTFCLRRTFCFTLTRKHRFRWTQCQIMTMTSCRWVKDMRTSLRIVPRTLEETYRNVLAEIPCEDRNIIREMLLWVTSNAAGPLTLDELAEAAVYSNMYTQDQFMTVEDLDIDSRLLDPIQLVRVCRSLLRHDATSGFVYLAHASVYDYLSSEAIRGSDVGFFYLDSELSFFKITYRCPDYLSMPAFCSGYCNTQSDLQRRRDDWPLSSYAAQTGAILCGCMPMLQTQSCISAATVSRAQRKVNGSPTSSCVSFRLST